MNGVRLGDIPGRWRGAAGCGWLEYEAFNIRKTSHQKEAILWRQIRGPRSVADLGSRAPYQPIVCSSQAAEATGLVGFGAAKKTLGVHSRSQRHDSHVRQHLPISDSCSVSLSLPSGRTCITCDCEPLATVPSDT
jgi:hypothetical protein